MTFNDLHKYATLHPPACLPRFFSITLQAQFAATAHIIDRSADEGLLTIEAADVDGDGKPDALCTFPNLVVWMKNDGAANFGSDRKLAGGEPAPFDLVQPGPPRLDLDADSLPDLACGVFWRKGLGNGVFAAPEKVFENTLAGFCDVNSDGLPDAVILTSSKIYYQKNLGGGQFTGFQLIADKTSKWPILRCCRPRPRRARRLCHFRQLFPPLAAQPGQRQLCHAYPAGPGQVCCYRRCGQ